MGKRGRGRGGSSTQGSQSEGGAGQPQQSGGRGSSGRGRGAPRTSSTSSVAASSSAGWASSVTPSGHTPPGQSAGSGPVRPPVVSTSTWTSTAAASTVAPESTAPGSTAMTSSSSSDSSATRELRKKMGGLSLLPKELQLGPFPKRPDAGGSSGRAMTVRVNHFSVVLSPDIDLCQYDVSISPEVTSPAVNRAIIAEVLRRHGKPTSGGPHLGGKLPAYDGRKIMYVNGTFPGGEAGPPLVFQDIEPLDEGKTAPSSDSGRSSRRKKSYRVTLKFAARLNLHALQQFLAGQFMDQPQDAINAFDIVLRERPCHRFVTSGRSFFSPEFGKPVPLSGGAVAVRGFFQSLRPSQTGLKEGKARSIMGMTLNLDMSSTPFYANLPVPDYIGEVLNRRAGTPFSEIDKVKVKRALKNVRVVVTHTKEARRHRIGGLTDKPLKDLWFPVHNDATGVDDMVNIVPFFRNKYNVELKLVNLPALDCGTPQKLNWIPLEVAVIAPKQKYVRKLTPQQTSSMLTSAKQFPDKRMAEIQNLVRQNDYENDPYSREFGVKVDTNMMEVQARVLNPPVLKYFGAGRESEVMPRGGAWNMMGKRVVEGSQVARWGCINFAGSGRDRDFVNPQMAEKFCFDLVRICGKTGLQMNPQMMFPIQSGVPVMPQAEQKLREVFALVSQGVPPNAKKAPIDILICILPGTSAIYGELKRISELDLGIVTQCIAAKNIPRANDQYLANVALKINVKCGGRNVFLAQKLPSLASEPTILFGGDVTHPSPGDDSSPSIAAVVASQDWPEATKYRGIARSQYARQEIISDLAARKKDGQGGVIPEREGIVTELIKSFAANTQKWPSRIIFFRDGVSEGQFDLVRDFEVNAIRRACTAISPNYKPRITFIVGQKRHHTRMFPTAQQNSDRSGNVLPGTVVDTAICSPNYFDFFLCSHAGLLGVSRPAKYVVLWDDCRMNSNDLQNLINSLCYTYAICTRSVSMVPPAYYAHKLAFRARYYLPADMSDTASRRSGGAPATAAAQAAVTESGATGASSSSGKSSRDAQEAYNFLAIPEIKDAVKRVMFYC